MTSSYPDLASPTDSVIAGDFGSLSAAEQERQRDEWKAELAKTEEEIHTLRQVRNMGDTTFYGKLKFFVTLRYKMSSFLGVKSIFLKFNKVK